MSAGDAAEAKMAAILLKERLNNKCPDNFNLTFYDDVNIVFVPSRSMRKVEVSFDYYYEDGDFDTEMDGVADIFLKTIVLHTGHGRVDDVTGKLVLKAEKRDISRYFKAVYDLKCECAAADGGQFRKYSFSAIF